MNHIVRTLTIAFSLIYCVSGTTRSCGSILSRNNNRADLIVQLDNGGKTLEGDIHVTVKKEDLNYDTPWSVKITFDQQVYFNLTSVSVSHEKEQTYNLQEGNSTPAFLIVVHPTDLEVKTQNNKTFTLTKGWGNITEDQIWALLHWKVDFQVRYVESYIDVIKVKLNDFAACEGPEICGDATQLMLSGGSSMQPAGILPWLTSIFKRTSASLEFKCGGTLVSKRHIVTAAHCVDSGLNGGRLRANEIVVYLGKSELFGLQSEPNVQGFAVSKISVHPDYNTRRGGKINDADIAVLELAKIVNFTEQIKPACLTEGEGNSNRGIMAGWGQDEYGELQEKSRSLVLPVVDIDTCRKSDERYENLTSDRTICAGFGDGYGPCKGDSGGGFLTQFLRSGDKPRFQLTGVVSKALLKRDDPSQCDLGQYAIFVKVSSFFSWLKDNTVTCNC